MKPTLNEGKNWYDGWSIITTHTNHGDIVKTISLPNAQGIKSHGELIVQEIHNGQISVIVQLLESALFEINRLIISESKVGEDL